MSKNPTPKSKTIFLHTDTPIAGGAEKHMQLLAKNLIKDGYHTTIICSNYPSLDTWCKDMAQDGIPVMRLNVKHKHDPRHYFLLKKILKENPPDILHLHLWNPGSCRYVFFATDRSKTKIIVTEHDPFPLSGLKKIIKKITLKKTDFTIVVSKDNEKKMLQWYPQISTNIGVIHNGIDLKSFDQSIVHLTQQEKKKIQSQLFKNNGEDFTILTIAALHPRKGLTYLIDAFAHVHEKDPKTRLIIVGEGPEKKLLENQIHKLHLESTIVLLGHQTDIPKILKCSDLFVLPSIKEAFGLVLLEAMAAQLPIIASNVGGIPEIIQDRQSGLSVEPANSKLLAEKILELIDNKPLREKLAFIGHHDVQHFEMQKMVKETERVYDEISSKE